MYVFLGFVVCWIGAFWIHFCLQFKNQTPCGFEHVSASRFRPGTIGAQIIKEKCESNVPAALSYPINLLATPAAWHAGLGSFFNDFDLFIVRFTGKDTVSNRTNQQDPFPIPLLELCLPFCGYNLNTKHFCTKSCYKLKFVLPQNDVSWVGIGLLHNSNLMLKFTKTRAPGTSSALQIVSCFFFGSIWRQTCGMAPKFRFAFKARVEFNENSKSFWGEDFPMTNEHTHECKIVL